MNGVGKMKVKVYRNLHKDLFSIVSVKTGKVIAHSYAVELKNAQFRVQPAGREKVRETKQRNVHAYVTGELVAMSETAPSHLLWEYIDWSDAYYNPYRCDTFIDYHDLSPVHQADRVVLHGKNISYYNHAEVLAI
jgi:hypothetical protein